MADQPVNLSARLSAGLSSLRGLAGRLLWLAMLLMHLPTVIGLLTHESGEGVRLVALLLSQVFFALKVADVRFLRLPKSPRVRAALLICVALLHADVVQRYAKAGGWPDIEPVTWVVLGSLPMVAAVAGTRPAQVRLRKLVNAWLRRWQRALQTPYAWLSEQVLLRIHQPTLIRVSLPHRAPPFSASY